MELSEPRRKSTREMVEEDTQTEPSVPPPRPAKNRPYHDDADDEKPRHSKTDKDDKRRRKHHQQQTPSPSRKDPSLKYFTFSNILLSMLQFFSHSATGILHSASSW